MATEVGDFCFQSPEDTILSKLRCSKLCGGSERQLDDVMGVVATQGPVLDLAYIRAWAEKLGVLVEFEDVLAEARFMWPGEEPA